MPEMIDTFLVLENNCGTMQMRIKFTPYILPVNNAEKTTESMVLFPVKIARNNEAVNPIKKSDPAQVSGFLIFFLYSKEVSCIQKILKMGMSTPVKMEIALLR